MKAREPQSREMRSMWVVIVFVNGKFQDTVCVSVELEVAMALAAQGNANAKTMKAPVEFAVIETLTDYALTGGSIQSFTVTPVEVPFDPQSN